jgi:hypothetical protein
VIWIASVPDPCAVCSALRALGENLSIRVRSPVEDTLVRLSHLSENYRWLKTFQARCDWTICRPGCPCLGVSPRCKGSSSRPRSNAPLHANTYFLFLHRKGTVSPPSPYSQLPPQIQPFPPAPLQNLRKLSHMDRTKSLRKVHDKDATGTGQMPRRGNGTAATTDGTPFRGSSWPS